VKATLAVLTGKGVNMKTGKQIIEEYNAQSMEIDNMSFKTLEEMIDENIHIAIEESAQICEKAPGGNRETVAKAIRRMFWLDNVNFAEYAERLRNSAIIGL